jgi:hypothetical protein
MREGTVSEIANFLAVLFDEHETTCFAETAYGVQVPAKPAREVIDTRYQFFSINPLMERRLDVNVTAHRNILLECDHLPLRHQEGYLKALRLEWSTAVFSGGKSIHFIIALERPLADRDVYDAVVRRIHRVVLSADKMTKNPSRLSRYPGHLRQDKGGREQKIIGVRERVANQRLLDWLELHAIPDEVKKQPSTTVLSGRGLGGLSHFTKNFIQNGAPEGERNHRLFLSACNCREVGLDIEQAYEVLFPALSMLGRFSEREFFMTIRSAYARRRR